MSKIAEQLKFLNAEKLDVDEMIELKAAADLLEKGYKDAGLPVPEYVTEGQKNLTREIASRTRAELERALKSAKAKRESLKSAEEKRLAADKEIAELEAKLGGGAAQVAPSA